jgi:hypothetical protein
VETIVTEELSVEIEKENSGSSSHDNEDNANVALTEETEEAVEKEDGECCCA